MAIFGAKMLDAKIGAIPASELNAWVNRLADAAPEVVPAAPDADAEKGSQNPEELVAEACVLLTVLLSLSLF